MAGAKRSQMSLDSFFKKPPVSAAVSNQPPSSASSSTAPQLPLSQPPESRTSSSGAPASSSASGAVASQVSLPVVQQDPSSSATSGDTPGSSSIEPSAQPQVPATTSAGRIVKSSDDEESDSDSSLEDLATLFQAKHSATQQKAPATKAAPSTPTASRFRSHNQALNVSPIVVPKYKFDLKYLAKAAKADDAIEASSKRVKALSSPHEEIDGLFPDEAESRGSKPNHLDLLGSVVANREDGDVHRVTRAIKRTEATLSEDRWYFFDTQANLSNDKQQPFPVQSVPQEWKDDLLDPKSRYQTFVSGFAEDMVSYGQALPDEIFLWILDELCREPSSPLRTSYFNVLQESAGQIERLLTTDLIQTLFKSLGGSPTGISVSEKIRSVQGVVDPYGNHKWDKLCLVVKFLGHASKYLPQSSRVYTISVLLRMSIDRVVFDNIDLFDQVQDAIGRLCWRVPEDAWEACCRDTCKSIFDCVEPATLRLQAVECVPSAFPETPRSHDLRRRLAMCFYFDDISYSLKHSHDLMDLDKFITRLEDPTFDLTPQADYRQLTALVYILNIAIDDARSTGLDLTDKKQEKRFDRDIDDLAGTIKDLMKGIGNPGAAFISKIEAKEALELVAQRIGDTLRSRPKPKDTIFDGPHGRAGDDLEGEKAGLQSFLSKMKKQEKE